MLYYEDLVVGVTRKFGHYPVTREEVVEFATRYDPQAFHLDDEAAAQTYFGRLSASGWHSTAMMMRMMVDNARERQVAALGSPGVDDLRWLKPVYPGDILSVEVALLSKRRMKSRPEMGLTRSRLSVFNQNDECVMTMIGNEIVAVRDPAGTD